MWKSSIINLISKMTSNDWIITTQNSSISMATTNKIWSDIGVTSISFDITDFSKISITFYTASLTITNITLS